MGRAAATSNRRPAKPPARPLLDLERYVPALLTFLANKLSKSATATYEREFGVNVTEWRILSLLALEPGATAARICTVIGFDKGPVSRTLAAMQAADILTTRDDPADARRRKVFLTRTGDALHDRIIAVALDREARLLACLDAQERETLTGLLNRLHANLPAVTGEGHGDPQAALAGAYQDDLPA